MFLEFKMDLKCQIDWVWLRLLTRQTHGTILLVRTRAADLARCDSLIPLCDWDLTWSLGSWSNAQEEGEVRAHRGLVFRRPAARNLRRRGAAGGPGLRGGYPQVPHGAWSPTVVTPFPGGGWWWPREEQPRQITPASLSLLDSPCLANETAKWALGEEHKGEGKAWGQGLAAGTCWIAGEVRNLAAAMGNSGEEFLRPGGAIGVKWGGEMERGSLALRGEARRDQWNP